MSLPRSVDPEHLPYPSLLNATATEQANSAKLRLNSIDLLRGVIMIVMVMDHARDFFGSSGSNRRDVTDPALFLTRWITHYCAPIFIFLAGVSVFLYGTKGRSRGEVSRFLLTRGLLLILLEFTVIHVAWTFAPLSTKFLAQVIWAIGASMVCLAGLIWLPRSALVVFTIVLIAGHNLLDGIHAEALGSAAWLWIILHQEGPITLSGTTIYALYPLVPWVAVIAAGYCIGPVYKWEAPARRLFLISLGCALILGFVLLRASNLYGDPAPWRAQATWFSTLLSFVDCQKYPPSLLYLTMTLGPALVLLAAFESARGRIVNWITIFGRVPLVFYIAHLYLLHLLALLLVLAMHGDLAQVIDNGPPSAPRDWGLSLLGVYAVWITAVVMLWPLCRWYAELKAGSRHPLLSYL